MNEHRVLVIKNRLEGHDAGKYHDASDMAVGFGEVVSEALELVEVVERAARMLARKREDMLLFGPAIEKARQDRDWMLVANFEIEKFKLQAEIDLLEYVVNG